MVLPMKKLNKSVIRRKLKETTKKNIILQQLDYLLDTFENNNNQLNWNAVKPVKNTSFSHEKKLPQTYIEIGQKALSEVALLKLNGGLGTTMGCKDPKSLLKAKQDRSFLDITIDQLKVINKEYTIKVPLILMNSNATSKKTKEAINKKYDYHEIIQNKFPRIDLEEMTVYSNNQNPDETWYPPGHGDLLLTLKTSGILSTLREKGIKYIFISNSDNLGATMSLPILGKMVSENLPFIMEVTEKTNSDVKGGIIAKVNNKLTLIERAQVPNHCISEFEDIKKYTIFNTNNIWINLSFLEKIYKDLPIKLPVINNQKEINQKKIMQLEMAIGSAMTLFDKSDIVLVDRNRFLPVKTTSDLLVLQSDLVSEITPGKLSVKQKIPVIRWDLNTLDQYKKSMQEIPSLMHLTSLEIKGPIQFKKNVKLSANIKIINTTRKPYIIENEKLSDIEIQVSDNGIKKIPL